MTLLIIVGGNETFGLREDVMYMTECEAIRKHIILTSYKLKNDKKTAMRQVTVAVIDIETTMLLAVLDVVEILNA